MAGKALRVAVIGMGGFAQSHHQAIRALEGQGECRLVCTCDPQPQRFRRQSEEWDLEGRGVRVFEDYRDMLQECAGELDVVTVPTPVPLHAPMHRACVERGLACYLEKPPTLFEPELDAMLAVEAGARRLTQVGFNFTLEEPRQRLKQRLLAGELGRLRRVGFLGLWPRTSAYYARAAWAGRLTLEGRPVLDSPLGNAMAHYLHNVLQWCGTDGVLSWDEAEVVEAELYRAHPIEGCDTMLARARTRGGVEVRVAATHASAPPQRQWERLETDLATLTYTTWEGYHLRWKDGREESGPADRRDLLLENLRAYLRYVRGEAPRPITRLEDSRPFVRFNGLLYLAGGRIHTVPSEHVDVSTSPEGDRSAAIRGVEAACEEFLASGALPSAQGVSWARSGGNARREDLPRLPALIAEGL